MLTKWYKLKSVYPWPCGWCFSTSAMSLLYECINTVIAGTPPTHVTHSPLLWPFVHMVRSVCVICWTYGQKAAWTKKPLMIVVPLNKKLSVILQTRTKSCSSMYDVDNILPTHFNVPPAFFYLFSEYINKKSYIVFLCYLHWTFMSCFCLGLQNNRQLFCLEVYNNQRFFPGSI